MRTAKTLAQLVAATLLGLFLGGSVAFATPTFTRLIVDLTAGVTGTLPIANGGTNSTATPTNGGIAYGTGSAFAFSTAGVLGDCLKSSGAGAPTWGSCSSISAYGTVQDEGSALTQRTAINFIGANITCVDNAGSGRTDCTISGGGSGITYADQVANQLAGF